LQNQGAIFGDSGGIRTPPHGLEEIIYILYASY